MKTEIFICDALFNLKNKTKPRKQKKMIIVRILSLLDIITAIMIILYQYGNIRTRLIISFTAYLLLKAFMFRGSFASFLDATIAIYTIIMIFLPITIITWIAAIYLIQKAISGLIL